MFIHPTAPTDARSRRVLRVAVHRSLRSGFTLLEVIAALALIVFLIGGVYAVGGGAVTLGSSINRSRVFETRINSFVSIWREYLESLPSGIRFSAKDKKLLIENGPVPFAWTGAVRRADAVSFSFERREEGKSFVVRHLKRPLKPTQPDEYKLISELPILEGLSSCDWEFYEPIKKEWSSTWDAKKRPQPPLFMRLNFAFEGDPRRFGFTFWVANDLAPAPAAPNPPQLGQVSGPPR